MRDANGIVFLKVSIMSNETEKRIIITRYKRTGQYFTENLGDGVGLDMVLIPGGTFLYHVGLISYNKASI